MNSLDIITYIQNELENNHYRNKFYCKKNYPKLYEALIQFKFNNDLDILLIADKVWCIKNNILVPIICKTCGKTLSNCRRSFCSTTCQVKYQHLSGCHTSPFKNINIQKKAQSTKLLKYGTLAVNCDKGVKTAKDNIDENGLNSYQRGRIKAQKTNLERYEYTSYSKTEKHRNLCSKCLHTDEANKNRENTFYKKYNKKCFLSTEESKRYKNTLEIREILRQKSFNYQKSLTKEQKLKQGYKKVKTRKKNGTLYSSKVEKEWLDNINIPNDSKHRQIQIYYRGRYHYNIDGFIPETKTIYEFLGDYYHGHPITRPNNIYFNQTFDRFKHLKSLGYNIVYCWESDFKIDKFFKRIFNNILEY